MNQRTRNTNSGRDRLEVVKTSLEERISEKSAAIKVPKISRQGSVTESKLTESSGEFPEVAMSHGDERAPTVAKYSATTAATARISCQRSAEIVKSITQERISERSQVSGVPKMSR